MVFCRFPNREFECPKHHERKPNMKHHEGQHKITQPEIRNPTWNNRIWILHQLGVHNFARHETHPTWLKKGAHNQHWGELAAHHWTRESSERFGECGDFAADCSCFWCWARNLRGTSVEPPWNPLFLQNWFLPPKTTLRTMKCQKKPKPPKKTIQKQKTVNVPQNAAAHQNHILYHTKVASAQENSSFVVGSRMWPHPLLPSQYCHSYAWENLRSHLRKGLRASLNNSTKLNSKIARNSGFLTWSRIWGTHKKSGGLPRRGCIRRQHPATPTRCFYQHRQKGKKKRNANHTIRIATQNR